ncbi:MULTISPECIES: HlyD family secretion protein [unclassified Acinetobacter]|uniref:HlyD family secretion protein n=1 Tax=unclassified Acinetobacter TaxID=196816 RepID=UPI00293435E1|nr:MULTISPECIES: HlyD family secretion protein [unclassified Acinetobacter]WOE31542.1 HlyD family secretion protein [Acinetobacter sp. SAAs470]WOE39738.1 HlyD family secretion protein [Acinetobacter sp. SAAs474]
MQENQSKTDLSPSQDSKQHEFIGHASKLIKTTKPMLALMFLVLIIGIFLILNAWKIGPFQGSVEATDNSYIHGKITVLSSQINGYIRTVNVNDFDHVKAGQILMTIDANSYQQKVTEAQALLTQAQNNLANQTQAIQQRKADILAAEAQIKQAQVNYALAMSEQKRYNQLKRTGAASASEISQIETATQRSHAALEEAQSNLIVTQEALKTAQVAEIGLQAQVTSAKAQLNQADITKNYSTINAPIDGQLGQIQPRVGQYVAAGTQLFTLVPQQTWVIANFKETQIAHIKLGQRAWFTVDALDGQKFMGHVDQIAPATGSQFSVIKPDNATGNFTKVVQRIAVRIQIDPDQIDIQRLRPGMSVETYVDTQSLAQ